MSARSLTTEPLSLKKNMLWNSAGSIVNLGCSWLITVLVVRLSGEYLAAGVLALAMAVFNTFSPLVDYRMYTYQISDTQHQNTTGEYLTFRLTTASLALVCATVYTLLTCSSSIWIAVLLYFIYQLITSLLMVFHAVMVLNSRMDYSGISNGLLGIVALVTFIGVFYPTQSLELTFAAMAVTAACVGVLYTYPRAAVFGAVKLGITKEKAISLALTCLPLVIANIACMACSTIPRQYLAATQGETLLGLYASVATPAVIIQMGASYIYNPLLSTFARRYHAGEKSQLASLLGKAAVGIALVSVVAGILLVLVGEWLLVLFFGEEIASYIGFLPPVIIMTSVTAFLWFFNDTLISLRKFRAVVAANAASFVLALGLTIPLIDAFGANGVSFTVTAAYAAGAIVCAVFVIRAVRSLQHSGDVERTPIDN